MGKKKALCPDLKTLFLESLEPRILLDAVNPGEPAIIQGGDELFFVQGQDEEEPDDLGGAPVEEWVVVARYEGPGRAELFDSRGGNTLDNGDKIGDIDIQNATEESHLVFENWVFREGFGLDSIGGAQLSDQPDTTADALEITVPEGETGDEANYNTGRTIASGSGEDIDFYKFSAQEAERFRASTLPSATIGFQYGDGPIQFQGSNDVILLDGNGNGEQDDVTVYVRVTGTFGQSYSMVVDRTEVNHVFSVDEEGNPDEQNTTVAEDFPESADAALDFTWDPATQTGLGPATPTVTLDGEGPGTSGNDFFKLTLDPLATIQASAFAGGLTGVVVRDVNGTFLTDLVGSGEFQNPNPEDMEISLDVQSIGDWSFQTSIKAGPVSDMVERPQTDDGEYIWFEGDNLPWMMDINDTQVTAPDGSGIAVITGDVTFDDTSTGFGLLGIDGSLKGIVRGLEPGETAQEILMGYMHGGGAGLDIGGNVDRLLVRTSVAELAETDVQNDPDEISPALVKVGGYLMEFQAGWTVFVDVEVRGEGPFDDFEFDYDAEEFGLGVFDPVHEKILTPQGRGLVSDTPDGAYVVGSPTGDFTVEGDLSLGLFGVPDLQDWYAFTPGVGQEIEVELDPLSAVSAAWVYGPSGRLVTVVTPEEDGHFVAGEAGAYNILLGEPQPDEAPRVDTVMIGQYTLSVSGARPVHLGGMVAGSDMFVGPDPSATLEFGDDDWDTEILVGYDGPDSPFDPPPGTEVNNASVGILTARQQGVYGDVSLWTTGSLGLVSGFTAASYDGDYSEFFIGADFDRFETRSTDPGQPGDMQFNVIEVGGDLVEAQSTGIFGGSIPLGDRVDVGGDVSVQGSVGSVVVDGDFHADMDVFGAGVDLFHVGGDFSEIASVGTGSGTDIAFAFVEGDIFNGAQPVEPVPAQGSIDFTDDGGTNVFLQAQSLHTQPVQVQTEQGQTITVQEPIPGTVSYRFLPLERAGTDQEVGAVPVEIVANDALIVTVGDGQVDLPRITFGQEGDDSFVEVHGTSSRARADVFSVETTAAQSSHIINTTNFGDILNVQAGAVMRIFAAGDLGVSERFVEGAGRRLNPDPTIFAPPAVSSISEDDLRHFSGIVTLGEVETLSANGSIGDAYIGGDLRTVQANVDGRVRGGAFAFRNMGFAPRSMNGIVGVVRSEGEMMHVDPGTGLFGGSGEVPVGGVIAGGEIENFMPTNSMISGPVMAEGGITQIIAINSRLEGATIGAGADLSDWAHWDDVRSTTNGVRLERLFVFGGGAGIERSFVQVGVLDQFLTGPQTTGVVSTDIWAVGDSGTEEGINNIIVLGGNLDGTDDPPYGGLESDLLSTQRIGDIFVANDLINLDVRSEKRIGTVTVQDSIRVTQDVAISAPLRLGDITANEIVGSGSLTFGTGQLDNVLVANDVLATVLSSGRVNSVHVGGTLDEKFEVTGSSGFLNVFTVGNVTSSGSVVSANFIRDLMVFNGNLDGDVQAGGSEDGSRAIGNLQVFNGDLGGDVTIVANESAVSPGGGIGFLLVGGDVRGDISTATFTDPASGETTRGNVGTAILLGDLRGDLDIDGGVDQLQIPNGRITSNGTADPRVHIQGNTNLFLVLGGGGGNTVDDDVSIDGGVETLILDGGDFGGDLDVGQTLGLAVFQNASDMTGVLTAGSIRDLILLGSRGVANTVMTTGRLENLFTMNGVDGSGAVQANGGLGTLQSMDDVNGPITVGGNGAGLIQIGSQLNAPLRVQSGDLETFLINNGNQDAVNAVVQVAGRLGFARISGNVTAEVSVGNNQPGDGVGTLLLMGNLEADLDVDGTAEDVQLIGGQATDNGAPEARVQISRDMQSFRAFGFTGGVEAISDDISVGGRLGFFQLSDGNFGGRLQAGTMGTIMYTNPGGIQEDVVSNADIDHLIVTTGSIGGGGGVTVSAFNHIDTIEAWGGIASDASVLAGTPGVSAGSMARVRVARGIEGLVEARTGSLQNVEVFGDMTGGELRAANSIVNTLVTGRFTDSDIQANTLGTVTVDGGLSDTTPGVPPEHEIHADTGSFLARIRGNTFNITPDEPKTIGGVKLSVG